jgi:hypothetical protein
MADGLMRSMEAVGIEVTRENYIAANWSEDLLPKKWTAEYEMELPEELQHWSLFEIVKGEHVFKGGFPDEK